MPNPNFETLDTKNQYKDTAATSFAATPALKTAIAASSGGSFTFNIPVRYRAVTDGGGGTVFITVPQVFMIDPSGSMTVTKGGASATRNGPK
jgi:hypothetical protein